MRTMRIILNIVCAGILLLIPGLAAPAGAAVPLDAAVETPLDVPPPAPSVEHGKAFTGDATPVEPGRVELEFAYAPSWWATAGAMDRLSGEQHTVAAAVSPNPPGNVTTEWNRSLPHPRLRFRRHHRHHPNDCYRLFIRRSSYPRCHHDPSAPVN